MSEQAAAGREPDLTAAMPRERGAPQTWWSDRPGGAKISALRLETVHLVHTGLAPEWDVDLVGEYFTEASADLPGSRRGASAGESSEVDPGAGPGAAVSLPPEVAGWIETLRYAHCELWPDAEEQGTTAVLSTAEALWVVTRGAHRVAIHREAGEGEPEEIADAPGGSRVWKLAREARWRVEVALVDGPSSLWTARWRSGPALVPRPEAEAVRPDAADASPPLGLRLPTWKPVLPAAWRPYRRELRLAGRIAAGLAALTLLWVVTPKRFVAGAWVRAGDFCAGRYRVQVVTVPPGAKLVVDGQETALRTPGWLVLREGRHRIDASLGEYGVATLSVDGRRGGRGAQGASLLGRLVVGCADQSLTLYGRLDGRPFGRLPAILDSVPAGRRQLSFQGRDARPWTEEVAVVAGRTTQLVARAERVPDFGVVLARAYKVGTEGLKDLQGAQVILDGKPVGSTPAKLQVARGLHTVRLSAGGVKSPVQLLRVEGGGELYATAEFGRSPEPEVVAELVGAPSAAHPPLVKVRLASSMPIRIAEVRLSVRRPGGDFERLPMTLRSVASGVEAEAALPIGGMAAGSRVSYFVTVKSDEGEEFVGEMHEVKLVP